MCASPSTPDLRTALSECETLSGLSESLLSRLFEVMQERRYAAGETIMSQGDPGAHLLLIVDGDAHAAILDRDGTRQQVGEFKRGDIVGEMALLTQEPRSADVVADSDLIALSLAASDFDSLAGKNPQISMLLTQLVADRLGRGAMDGLGGKILDSYQIVRSVGRGGMAVVYEAEHVDTRQRVALKMMSHHMLFDRHGPSRFRREAELIRSFDHDNIARLHGTFEAFKTHFLVMDYCEGPTLHDVIVGRPGGLTEEQIRPILGHLARALIYVHDRGLVHRDLKPSNVMFSDGELKVMDFGIATSEPGLSDETLTAPGAVCGTPSYMSPEQIAGEPATTECDLYAFACIAFELATGVRLFLAENLVQLIREKMVSSQERSRELREGISKELRTIVELGLHEHPAQRSPVLDIAKDWSGDIDSSLLIVSRYAGPDEETRQL